MRVFFFFAIFCLFADILGQMEQRTAIHTSLKGCFTLSKMFYPVGQIKLAVGGGDWGKKKSDAWGSN